ncbi:virion core protein, T7 gp14 family [Blastochloris tepida]|nr:hypothetical protein [Blastochloris tepida]
MAALAVGSTVAGVAGQMQSANASAAASSYNASVQRENARLADMHARRVLEAGADEERKQRAATQRLIGKQTAGMAANGLDITFGSPLDLIVDTATQGEIDAMTIRTNAYRNSDDVRNQAASYRNKAALYDMEADNSRTSGMLSAAGTVLTGAGQAYGLSKYGDSYTGLRNPTKIGTLY